MGHVIASLLRVFQFLLAGASLGLTTFVVNSYLTETEFSAPPCIDFLVFAPIFSLVSLLYLELVPRLAPRASHPFVSLAVEVLNAIFYFAGFIALAVFLGDISFCNGVACAAARADVVLTAAGFAAWSSSTILLAKLIFKADLRKPGRDRVQPATMMQSSRPAWPLPDRAL